MVQSFNRRKGGLLFLIFLIILLIGSLFLSQRYMEGFTDNRPSLDPHIDTIYYINLNKREVSFYIDYVGFSERYLKNDNIIPN